MHHHHWQAHLRAIQTLLILTGTLALPGMLTPCAQAAIVIDQQQNIATWGIADFTQYGLAQSFTPTFDNIIGAGFFVSTFGSSPVLTLSLYDALPTEGGTLLASGSTHSAPALGFADVSFAQTAITPGATYYLVCTSDTSFGEIRGSIANPYAGGQTYADTDPFPAFDYAFRTFAVVVPEGSTAALLIAALPLLAFRTAIRTKRLVAIAPGKT